MPRKPLRPCSHPGCPELVEGSYCDKHLKEHHKNYNRYGRNPDSKNRYGSAWRKIRNSYINRFPLCAECLKAGKVTPAQEVHHIIPLGNGGTHADENLMSLCKSCHSRISILEGQRFG